MPLSVTDQPKEWVVKRAEYTSCCIFWIAFECCTLQMLVLYLSICIDSKSFVWDSPCCIDWWLGLASYRPNNEIRTQRFWFSIFTWLIHCTINLAYILSKWGNNNTIIIGAQLLYRVSMNGQLWLPFRISFNRWHLKGNDTAFGVWSPQTLVKINNNQVLSWSFVSWGPLLIVLWFSSASF